MLYSVLREEAEFLEWRPVAFSGAYDIDFVVWACSSAMRCCFGRFAVAPRKVLGACSARVLPLTGCAGPSSDRSIRAKEYSTDVIVCQVFGAVMATKTSALPS